MRRSICHSTVGQASTTSLRQGAVLPRQRRAGATPAPRLAVGALGGEEDEVGVQLGVGNAAGLLVLGEAKGGVDGLSGGEALGTLEAHHPAALAFYESDLALGSCQRAGKSAAVGGLDLGAPEAPAVAQVETDFGGAIISSTPATLEPLEPAGRRGSPVSGEKPCITARRSLRATGLLGVEAKRAQ